MKNRTYSDLGLNPHSDEQADPTPMHVKVMSLVGVALLLAAAVGICALNFVFARPWNAATFLTINDMHVATQYLPFGSNKNGNHCMNESALGSVNFTYGQYSCDPPYVTLDSAFDKMRSINPNPSFVAFMGDAPSHWTDSMADVQYAFNYTVQGLRSRFPSTPIIVNLGNNEYYPDYGTFATDAANFASLAEVMKDVLSPSQLETFRKGGYYLQDFPSIDLRLISINSVIYSTRRESTTIADPYDQFAFLENAIAEGKRKGLEIGIISHMPPGMSYWDLEEHWNATFAARFHSIIANHKIAFVFSAHTHVDLILPLFTENGTACGYTLNSPSISPLHGNNPTFRSYYWARRKVIDYLQYYFDLMVDSHAEPDWEIEYSYYQTYRMDDCSMNTLGNLARKIKNDPKLFKLYSSHVTARADFNSPLYYCLFNSVSPEDFNQCTANMTLPTR